MSNWYTTREAFKRAKGVSGSASDALIDQHIAGASRTIDKRLGKRVGGFFPETATHYFPWPQRRDTKQILDLDEDLLSVTALKTANETVTIVADDYFLEPANTGPPHRTIEIDLGDDVASDAEFGWDDSSQRAISVEGSWGYGNATKAAGAMAEGLDNNRTTLLVSDASLIDVGDTLLIESEQMFVSGRSTQDTSANINGALTADQSETTVTVTDGTKVKAGEVILIDAERFYVESVTGNNLAVQRAYDGTALAAHNTAKDVYVFRVLTIVRGTNGTTAVAHDDATAITKYAPPADIQTLCQAEAIFNYEQDRSGHTGIIGGAEGMNVNPNRLRFIWEKAIADYGELAFA